MNTALERLAQRVVNDPLFLAAILHRYVQLERIDDGELAQRLGCTLETLTQLRLCQTPNPNPPHFMRGIERIAGTFQLDPDMLAQVVRLGQALLHLERTDQPAVADEAGLLMAARDKEPEETTPTENEP